MSNKHTPGPWKLCTNELDQEFNITGPDSFPVCMPYTIMSSKYAKWSNKKLPPRQLWESVANEREQANARLIAAAPELLEALIDAREELAKRTGEFGADWDGTSMLIRMDTAIASVKGGAA